MGRGVAAYAERILGGTGKVLELGCGRGEFLQGAIDRGWSAFGVEMTNEYAKIAHQSGVSVESRSIQDSEFLDDKYDLIILEAILEHLYDPRETLQRIKQALRPGGLLFIEVPNERSLVTRVGNKYMRFRGRDWVINLSPTFPPFHVVGFAPQTLRALLEQLGFVVQKIETPKWQNSLPKGESLVSRMEHFLMDIVQRTGSIVGMGDGIVCWAMNPENGRAKLK
jgi:SAM-dependent methyltransferase